MTYIPEWRCLLVEFPLYYQDFSYSQTPTYFQTAEEKMFGVKRKTVQANLYELISWIIALVLSLTINFYPDLFTGS